MAIFKTKSKTKNRKHSKQHTNRNSKNRNDDKTVFMKTHIKKTMKHVEKQKKRTMNNKSMGTKTIVMRGGGNSVPKKVHLHTTKGPVNNTYNHLPYKHLSAQSGVIRSSATSTPKSSVPEQNYVDITPILNNRSSSSASSIGHPSSNKKLRRGSVGSSSSIVSRLNSFSSHATPEIKDTKVSIKHVEVPKHLYDEYDVFNHSIYSNYKALLYDPYENQEIINLRTTKQPKPNYGYSYKQGEIKVSPGSSSIASITAQLDPKNVSGVHKLYKPQLINVPQNVNFPVIEDLNKLNKYNRLHNVPGSKTGSETGSETEYETGSSNYNSLRLFNQQPFDQYEKLDKTPTLFKSNPPFQLVNLQSNPKLYVLDLQSSRTSNPLYVNLPPNQNFFTAISGRKSAEFQKNVKVQLGEIANVDGKKRNVKQRISQETAKKLRNAFSERSKTSKNLRINNVPSTVTRKNVVNNPNIIEVINPPLINRSTKPRPINMSTKPQFNKYINLQNITPYVNLINTGAVSTPPIAVSTPPIAVSTTPRVVSTPPIAVSTTLNIQKNKHNPNYQNIHQPNYQNVYNVVAQSQHNQPYENVELINSRIVESNVSKNVPNRMNELKKRIAPVQSTINLSSKLPKPEKTLTDPILLSHAKEAEAAKAYKEEFEKFMLDTDPKLLSYAQNVKAAAEDFKNYKYMSSAGPILLSHAQEAEAAKAYKEEFEKFMLYTDPNLLSHAQDVNAAAEDFKMYKYMSRTGPILLSHAQEEEAAEAYNKEFEKYMSYTGPILLSHEEAAAEADREAFREEFEKHMRVTDPNLLSHEEEAEA